MTREQAPKMFLLVVDVVIAGETFWVVVVMVMVIVRICIQSLLMRLLLLG